MLTEEEEKMRLQLVKIVKHLQCSICLNLMMNPMITQCVHRFCNLCICQSIHKSSGDYCRCPLCNEKITKRSLREQKELSLIINSVKKVVHLFENDNHLTSIMNSDDIIVFETSTDKSKSSDDSVFEDIITIDDKDLNNKTDNVCIDNKVSEKQINDSKDINAIESDRKSSLPTTTISVSDHSWPTCEDTIDVNQSNICDSNKAEDMTDIYINNTSAVSNDCSLVEKSIEQLNKLETDESTEIINENRDKSKAHSVQTLVMTQSKDLSFSKSRITYSTTRKTSDKRFDEIISKANNNVKVGNNSENKLTESNDKIEVKPIRNRKEYVSSEDSEDECVDSFYPIVKDKSIEQNGRKPLKRLHNNEILDDKKKFKRVQRFDSSDDEIDSPVVLNRKRKLQNIRESEPPENDLTKELEIPESDLSDDELLMTSIHAKNDSIDTKRTSVSFQSEREGYHSDTQLITSSPSFDFE